MRSIKLLAALVPLAAAFAVSAQAEPGTQSKLMSVGGGDGAGMLEVSPTAHDVLAPDSFDVQGTVNVHDLAPDSGYKILRWVDFNPDGNCTGTAARLLPGNPTLTTSDGGAGALHFEIDNATIHDGTRFDVIWRVVDLSGITVLQSDCLTVTAK